MASQKLAPIVWLDYTMEWRYGSDITLKAKTAVDRTRVEIDMHLSGPQIIRCQEVGTDPGLRVAMAERLIEIAAFLTESALPANPGDTA